MESTPSSCKRWERYHLVNITCSVGMSIRLPSAPGFLSDLISPSLLLLSNEHKNAYLCFQI